MTDLIPIVIGFIIIGVIVFFLIVGFNERRR